MPIPVTLTNRTAYIECTGELYEELRNFWAYQVPGSQYSPKFKLWLQARKQALLAKEPNRELPGWDGKIRLFSRNRLSAGLFRATYTEAQEALGLEFEIHRKLPKAASNLKVALFEIEEDDKYSYQLSCINSMQKAIKRGGGTVLASTGAGKTRMAGGFFKVQPALQCLFVVDTLDLLYQSQKEIHEWAFEKIGIVGDSKFEPERITVATIQTLQKHIKRKDFVAWFKSIQILIVDEVHEQMAKRNFKLLQTIKPLAIFGLTATLQLKRKEVRYRVYSFSGPVIFEFPLEEGVERGVLTEGKAIQLLFPALPIIPTANTDAYTQQVLTHQGKLNACVKLAKALISKGRYVIVLVERVQHLKDLDELFSDVPHLVAYGAVKKTFRKEAIDSFEKGDVKLLIANKVFKKGISIRRVDAGIDMAEKPSKNDAIQKYGRLVRLHPDKNSLLYIDFGTQKGKTGDYGLAQASAAVKRFSAYKAAGIPVKRIEVNSSKEALAAVESELNDARTAYKKHS